MEKKLPTEFATSRADEITTRNAGLDALRSCMTLLVVFHHCAITYGAIGGWYYHEIAPSKSFSAIVLVFFCTVNQAFFMGLFFLLAGYFTPAALARKGPTRFLLDRFLRLGLPLLFFGWILGPVTIALASTSQGHPFIATLRHLWRRGVFDTGPMWFAQALLIFVCVAVFSLAIFPRGRNKPVADTSRFPSNTVLAMAALATGAVALALRMVWPVGVNVWGLQLAYFASYVLLFAAGCAAARPRWLEHLPPRQVRVWWYVCLVALPILPLVYFLGQAMPVLRGWPLRAVYAFWEPLVAWGAIMLLVDRFQTHFQACFNRLHGLWRSLARRAYAIYIVHPPLLVAVALSWRHIPAYPLLKFAVTGSVTCALCFMLAGVLLRVPVLKKIL